jgi:multidrug efflux pump subunit AcrA (membrane-fusion protein)
MSKGTGTVLVRAEFLNPDNILLPNTFVTLVRDVKVDKVNPCVYEQSLFVRENGKQAVWVVKDDSTVELREVETGNKEGRMVPVLKGLAKGEKVAITAVSKLADKMKVAVVAGKATPNDDLDPDYESPIVD